MMKLVLPLALLLSSAALAQHPTVNGDPWFHLDCVFDDVTVTLERQEAGGWLMTGTKPTVTKATKSKRRSSVGWSTSVTCVNDKSYLLCANQYGRVRFGLHYGTFERNEPVTHASCRRY